MENVEEKLDTTLTYSREDAQRLVDDFNKNLSGKHFMYDIVGDYRQGNARSSGFTIAKFVVGKRGDGNCILMTFEKPYPLFAAGKDFIAIDKFLAKCGERGLRASDSNLRDDPFMADLIEYAKKKASLKNFGLSTSAITASRKAQRAAKIKAIVNSSKLNQDSVAWLDEHCVSITLGVPRKLLKEFNELFPNQKCILKSDNQYSYNFTLKLDTVEDIPEELANLKKRDINVERRGEEQGLALHPETRKLTSTAYIWNLLQNNPEMFNSRVTGEYHDDSEADVEPLDLETEAFHEIYNDDAVNNITEIDESFNPFAELNKLRD